MHYVKQRGGILNIKALNLYIQMYIVVLDTLFHRFSYINNNVYIHYVGGVAISVKVGYAQ